MEKTSDKVSVIIPMYNCEQTLKKCVKSILTQEYGNLEIVLVDDGSLDSTLTIARQFQKSDKRIKIIEKENGGVSTARNKGLEVANGELIFFCDSDDWLEEKLILQLVKIQKKENLDLVISGGYGDCYINNEIVKTGMFGVSFNYIGMINDFWKKFFYFYRSSNLLLQSPWAKIYRKEIIKKNSLKFNTNMVCFEDFEFNLRYLSKCQKVGVIKEIGYHYYQNIKQNYFVKRKKEDLTYEVTTLHHTYLNCMQEVNYSEEEKKYMEKWFFESYMLVLKNALLIKDNKKIVKIVKKLFTNQEFQKTKEILGFRFLKLIDICLKLHFSLGVILILKRKLA